MDDSILVFHFGSNQSRPRPCDFDLDQAEQKGKTINNYFILRTFVRLQMCLETSVDVSFFAHPDFQDIAHNYDSSKYNLVEIEGNF